MKTKPLVAEFLGILWLFWVAPIIGGLPGGAA